MLYLLVKHTVIPHKYTHLLILHVCTAGMKGAIHTWFLLILTIFSTIIIPHLNCPCLPYTDITLRVTSQSQLANLVLNDTADFESMQDPDAVIESLFCNAYKLLIPILDPYLEEIKSTAKFAIKYGGMKGNVDAVSSATDVEDLLCDLGVQWNDIRFLQKAVTAIPGKKNRAVANAILCHYRTHHIQYNKAVKILKGGPALANQMSTCAASEEVLPMEITVSKNPENYTCDDCLQLWNKFLVETLKIPSRFITAGPTNSTILVFHIPQQYSRSIKDKLLEGRVVCVMLQLDIVRVRIPDVCEMDLRALAPQELSASIRDGLMSYVDFMSLTQVSHHTHFTSIYSHGVAFY